ncbi:zinc finger protein 280A-like [Rhynchocyon petersi]
MNIPSKDVNLSSSDGQNEALISQGYANDKIHLNLRNPLTKNSLDGLAETDLLRRANQHRTFGLLDGHLMVLLPQFYIQQDGNRQSEQKTHTTFKCLSCQKVLKNIKFMKHMKHHLELERQRGDSWDSHTTCRHCHRQFLTPFQLQCHVDSVHIAQEPSWVCRICELSFDTDEALLQHMKDTHKPGEMPYVCQVCSYRSSVFSDMEAHFRASHENTKSLLCPFCLKVFKIATAYMGHCWKHQNKTAIQCSKCRLQFLTSKEKMEHETKNH